MSKKKDRKEELSTSEESNSGSKNSDDKKEKKREKDENDQHIYYRKYVAKNGDIINYEVGRYKPKGTPRGHKQTPLSKVKRLVSQLDEDNLKKVEKYIEKLNITK